MGFRRLSTALTAALVAASAGAMAAAEAGAAASKPRLRGFASCPALIAYGRGHAAREQRSGARRPLPRPAGPPVFPPPAPVGGAPTGGAVPAATAAPTEDSSTTNVQEAGVDEPDSVKSDGSRIFALSSGKLHAVEARSGTPRLLGSLAIEGSGYELLVEQGRALVVSFVYDTGGGGGGTLLTEVDVRNPAAMRILRTERITGAYLSGRLNGTTARLVIVSRPRAMAPGGEGLRSRAAGWVPSFTLRDRRTGQSIRRQLSSCRAVSRAPAFSGLDVVTVLTIDMTKGLPAIDADAVLSDAQTVYASRTGLYIATQKSVPAPSSSSQPPPPLTSAIHRWDISKGGVTTYRASGEVSGTVLNQFSLSEHRGFLRVATTDQPPWWRGGQRPRSQSFVTVLDERSGGLVPVGRVGGLGEGERIYAVRFIDDAGFVVTFRQVDPLYTLDLSTPTHPRVLGELKILGYSAYLHPIGGDLLLGVGQDATEEGRLRGAQLSLFDISDLRSPVRLHARKVGSSAFGHTRAEYDHRAFLYWAPSGLTVLPVQLSGNGSERPFLGALGFRMARASGIEEAGRVSHSYDAQRDAPVTRSFVVGGRLFTVSDAGVKASSLADLTELAWVPFP